MRVFPLNLFIILDFFFSICMQRRLNHRTVPLTIYQRRGKLGAGQIPPIKAPPLFLYNLLTSDGPFAVELYQRMRSRNSTANTELLSIQQKKYKQAATKQCQGQS